jgi:predicted CoA-substrate-specific enzyme activase
MQGTILGIDIGSAAIKAVLVGADGIVGSTYRRLDRAVLDAFREIVAWGTESFPQRRPEYFALTGRGAEGLAQANKWPLVNEIFAQASGARLLVPEARSVIDIGGNDAAYIALSDAPCRAVCDASGVPAANVSLAGFATNSRCAAGTGSFLEQQAARLGLDIEGNFSTLALSAEHVPHIAGRCSVFAKSDMIHLQQIATPDNEIVAGLCLAMAESFKSDIMKGVAPALPISFQGGVARNAAMAAFMRRVFALNDDELIVHPQAHFAGALGAALRAGVEAKKIHITEAGRAGRMLRSSDATLAPLAIPASAYLKPPVAAMSGGDVCEVFLGIDVGSVSTNVALLDRAGNLIAKRYLPTAGRPIEAVLTGLREINTECGKSLRVLGCGTTGSGRYLIGDLFGADIIKNEITAQARGALLLCPDADTIFEIGGQDSKYIAIDNGVVTDFTMNKACAAGTGSFIEEQANLMGINVREDFAARAFASEEPAALGQRCTVFIENDVLGLLAEGDSIENLCAGIAYSVVYNYLHRVVENRRIGRKVLFQGGTACNQAVTAAFRAVTGKDVLVPPHNDITGAIGMAAIVSALYQEKEFTTSFVGLDCGDLEYSVRTFICNACANKCQIREVRRGAHTKCAKHIEPPPVEPYGVVPHSDIEGAKHIEPPPCDLDGSVPHSAMEGAAFVRESCSLGGFPPVESCGVASPDKPFYYGHRCERYEQARGIAVGAEELDFTRLRKQLLAGCIADLGALSVEELNKVISSKSGSGKTDVGYSGAGAGAGAGIESCGKNKSYRKLDKVISSKGKSEGCAGGFSEADAAKAGEFAGGELDKVIPENTAITHSDPTPAAHRTSRRIGIPFALSMYEMLPFWVAFWIALDYEVVYTGETTRALAESGILRSTAETCYPVKVLHGHVEQLFTLGVEQVFVPSVINMPLEGSKSEHNFSCTLVQAAPFLLRSAFRDCTARNGEPSAPEGERRVGVGSDGMDENFNLKFLNSDQKPSARRGDFKADGGREDGGDSGNFNLKFQKRNQNPSAHDVQSPSRDPQGSSHSLASAPARAILAPVIHMQYGRNRVLKELVPFVKDLKISKRRLGKALDTAYRAQELWRKRLEGAALDFLSRYRDRPLAVIASRAYNGCDSGLNLDIPRRLAESGIPVITLEAFPISIFSERHAARSLPGETSIRYPAEGNVPAESALAGNASSESAIASSAPTINIPDAPDGNAPCDHVWGNMYWRSGQRIMRGLDWAARTPGILPLYITNFSCGPDSFLLHYAQETMKSRPLLVLELDEHSADAGIVTRLEAYLDSALPRAWDEVKERPLPPARSEISLRGKRVYVPYMGDVAMPIAAAFRRAGIDASTLPLPDRRTIELGRRLTSGRECYPLVLTAGEIFKIPDRPDYEAGKAVFFMPTTNGPCRFGEYARLHSLLLEREKLSEIEIFSPNSGSGYEELRELSMGFYMDIWKGMVCIDTLGKALHAIRPREETPGASDALYQECLTRLESALESKKRNLPDLMRDFQKRFQAIPRRNINCVPIGMVGEIYVRLNSFANGDIIRRLERLGAEVVYAPFSEWSFYVNRLSMQNNFDQGMYMSGLNDYLRNKIQYALESRLVKPFHREALFEEPEINAVLRAAEAFIDRRIRGEAVLTVGKAVDFAARGFGGIVNVLPFSCMPGLIASSLAPSVQDHFGDLPWLNLTFEDSAVDVDAMRLEAFVEQARSYHSRMRGKTYAQ